MMVKMPMKHLILFLGLPFLGLGQDLIGPMNISYNPAFELNETETTLILSSFNGALGAVNAAYFKDDRRRSNAGFYVFPGLLQMAYGVSVQGRHRDLGALNIAVGSAGALFSAVRLIWPSKKKDGQVYLQPCLFRQNKKPLCGMVLTMRL